MKSISKFGLAIGVLIFAVSCVTSPEDCTNYDYSGCNTWEPDSGVINIKVTINIDNPQIPVTIYRGKMEDSVIECLDTIDHEEYSLRLPVDNYYTVAAEYFSEIGSVIAVDGDNIKKKSKILCDSTCWSVKEANINVRLKY